MRVLCEKHCVQAECKGMRQQQQQRQQWRRRKNIRKQVNIENRCSDVV
jgi:hypothetical protein